MSELKIVTLYGVDALNNDIERQYYHKSEADKVIAEKDTKIIQLEAFIENYNRISREIINNANHQKHKRCLAMARICYMKSWDCLQHISPREKYDHWKKWQTRWTELADKFKEAK